MYVESPIRGPASAVVVGCKFCNRQSSSSWRMCPKTRALSVCRGTHASKQCTNDSLRLVCSGISPTIPGRAALLELLNSCTLRPNTITSLSTPLGRHGVSVFRYPDLQYSSRCPVGPQVTLYFGSRAAPSEPLAGGVKVRSPAGAAERGFCVLKTWLASDCNASNPLLGALRKKKCSPRLHTQNRFFLGGSLPGLETTQGFEVQCAPAQPIDPSRTTSSQWVTRPQKQLGVPLVFDRGPCTSMKYLHLSLCLSIHPVIRLLNEPTYRSTSLSNPSLSGCLSKLAVCLFLSTAYLPYRV